MPKVFLGPVVDAVHHALGEEWFGDEDTNYRMGFGKSFLGKGKAQVMLNDMLSETAYGIYEGTKPIGFIRIRNGEPDSRTVKLWMFVSPEHRRSGVGEAAMAQALDRVFEKAHRVEVDVLKIHEEGVSFLRSMGFAQEGKREGAHYMHGDAYTVFPFRMLRKHWKKKKRRQRAA